MKLVGNKPCFEVSCCDALGLSQGTSELRIACFVTMSVCCSAMQPFSMAVCAGALYAIVMVLTGVMIQLYHQVINLWCFVQVSNELGFKYEAPYMAAPSSEVARQGLLGQHLPTS